MDELINKYADSAAAYASSVQELRLLSQTRHTRSAFLAGLEVVEKACHECDLARLAFRQPPAPKHGYIAATDSISRVMEDHIQQRPVNVKSAVVVDEAQLAELVHEKADSRARGANDLSQCFLANLGNHRLRFAFLPVVGEQEQNPRQPLFTGIEKLVHQVLLNPNVAGEHIGEE